MASKSTYWPAIASERARESRAFVRSLLQKKQPEFAAVLELIARELLAEQFTMAGLAPVGGGPVLYLLSPAAGYLTGQALRLDGGPDLGQAGLYR
jgi:hypothetical protein